MHASFVNTYALRTPAGLLLIDPGFEHRADRRASGGARLERRPACIPPSTRTATPTMPSACGRSSTPASGRTSSRRRTARPASAATADARLERAHQPAAVQPAGSRCSRSSFDWPTLTFRDALDPAPRRSRGPLPRRQGRDRRRLLGMGSRAALPLHRRPDHLAGAQLRQPAEGAALSGRMGRGARGDGRARRRVAVPRATASSCTAARRCAPCSPIRPAICGRSSTRCWSA